MNINLNLKGLSFQEQKELLLLKKELLELEQNEAYNIEKSKIIAQQEQILFEYEVWEDYIEWLARHGVWWENSDHLNPLKYARSSDAKYKGIIPKYPRSTMDELKKDEIVRQHGKDIEDGLNNVARGCDNIANATLAVAVATNSKFFKRI